MKIWIGILLSLSLLACQKPTDRACWKGAGDTQLKQIPFESFDFLHIHPHMEVELIQDSLNFIEWEANENLMNFLVAEKSLDTLILRNQNRCHFLRYRKETVKVRVHFKQLKQILFENSELVSTQGIWQQNVFELILKEGAGPIDFQLAGSHAFVRNLYGWQNVHLVGQLDWLYADLDGSALIDAHELVIQDSLLFSGSSPLSSQFATPGILVKAQLHSIGDLFLKGTPSLLLQKAYSSGKVIVD